MNNLPIEFTIIPAEQCATGHLCESVIRVVHEQNGMRIVGNGIPSRYPTWSEILEEKGSGT